MYYARTVIEGLRKEQKVRPAWFYIAAGKPLRRRPNGSAIKKKKSTTSTKVKQNGTHFDGHDTLVLAMPWVVALQRLIQSENIM